MIKLDEDDIYIIDLPENPIPNNPSLPRVKTNVNYALTKDRFKNDNEMAKEMGFEQDEIFIENPDLPQKKIKGFVEMDKYTEDRWKLKLN